MLRPVRLGEPLFYSKLCIVLLTVGSASFHKNCGAITPVESI